VTLSVFDGEAGFEGSDVFGVKPNGAPSSVLFEMLLSSNHIIVERHKHRKIKRIC
jgi:hypothetical protein